MTARRPIRVLVVDDSALVRHVFTELLGADPRLEVVGTARDGVRACERIAALEPDVVTLDLEMPRMDGLHVLEVVMRSRPLPVVVVSAATEEGCEITLRALALGAVDVAAKPRLDLQTQLPVFAADLAEMVVAAAGARPRPRAARAVSTRVAPLPAMRAPWPVVLIGASTGGPEALREIVESLPADAPPVLVVQHMPAGFTRSLAASLDRAAAVEVKEAEDNDEVRPSRVLIAPGDHHMEVAGRDGALRVVVSSSPRVNRHRPSVDVLFASAARTLGRRAVGVILTGMGADGVAGLQAMRLAGAYTLAQDPETCVVPGMPGQAIRAGVVDRVVPLAGVATAILSSEAGRPRRPVVVER